MVTLIQQIPVIYNLGGKNGMTPDSILYLGSEASVDIYYVVHKKNKYLCRGRLTSSGKNFSFCKLFKLDSNSAVPSFEEATVLCYNLKDLYFLKSQNNKKFARRRRLAGLG